MSISVWSEPVAARPYSELPDLLSPAGDNPPSADDGSDRDRSGMRAVGTSQPSRRDMACAQLTTASTWPESSVARHSTDHG